MTRIDLTSILAPGALQPRREGPRAGTTPDVPPTIPLHLLPHQRRGAALTTVRCQDDEPIPPAPAVQFTPAVANIAGAPIDAAPPQRKPMRTNPAKDAVLAALQKHSPITRDLLLKQLSVKGIPLPRIDQAIFLLNKEQRITKGGTQANRQYGLPGTKLLPAATPARAAKVKPAKAKPAKKPRSTGTSTVTPFAARHDDLMPGPKAKGALVTHAPADTRAIRLFDGGALILQGGFAVAELTPPQFEAVARLANVA